MNANLKVSRVGDNLFVDGLPSFFTTIHAVPALGKEDLAIDDGKRAYLKVGIRTHGIEAWILRMSDDAVFAHYTTTADKLVIAFDPWDYIPVLEGESV